MKCIPKLYRWLPAVSAICAGILSAVSAQAVESNFTLPSLSEFRAEGIDFIGNASTRDDKDARTALALIVAGHFDAAVAKANAAVKANPNSAPAHEVLGMALAKKNLLADAIAAFEAAISINPRQSTAITKLGDVYLASGHASKARAEFERALRIDPDDRHANQRLGLLLLEETDGAEKALPFLERGLVGTPPTYIGIKINLGMIYNQQRNYAKTEALLEPILKLERPDATALLTLGTAYLALGKVDDATRAFEHATRVEPDAERAKLSLAAAKRLAGKPAESMKDLDAILAVNGKSEGAHFHKGMALLELKRVPDAIASFNAAAGLSSESHQLQALAAAALLSGKHYAEAITFYSAAVKSGKSPIRAYDGLATAYQLSGELDQAKRVLGDALGKFEKNAFIHFRLGMLHGYAQEYDHALRALEQAAQLAPSEPRIIKALSAVHWRLGNKDAAVSDAKKLVTLAPKDIESRVYLAGILESNSQIDAAVAEYERALELFADHPVALNNLALLLSGRGEIQRARDLARRATEVFPGSAPCQDTFGWLSHLDGDDVTARNALEIALNHDRNNSVFRAHLGVVLASLGEKDAAMNHLRFALNSSSNFTDREAAARALEMLEKGNAIKRSPVASTSAGR